MIHVRQCYSAYISIFLPLLILNLLYRFRISLFSRWKQRGMYALCMWVVQLLLVLSKMDSVFVYIPEFYLESLVNSFCRLPLLLNRNEHVSVSL